MAPMITPGTPWDAMFEDTLTEQELVTVDGGRYAVAAPEGPGGPVGGLLGTSGLVGGGTTIITNPPGTPLEFWL